MRPEDVALFKILCISFGAIIFLIVFLLHIWSWWESVGREPKIKFKAFKRFYVLNADRWECKHDNVYCIVEDGQKECFHFGFIDYYRYRLWMRKQDNIREDNHNMQIMARMVAAVKKDIASNEQKANQYLTDAANNIRQILQE